MSGYAVAGFTAFTAAWYACKQITSSLARRSVDEDENDAEYVEGVGTVPKTFFDVKSEVNEEVTNAVQPLDTSIMSDVTEVEGNLTTYDFVDEAAKQPFSIQMQPVKAPVTYSVIATQTETAVTTGCMCPACESKFSSCKVAADRTAEFVRCRADAHTPASISPVPSTAESGTTESVETTSTSTTPVPPVPAAAVPTTPVRPAKQFFSIATPELSTDDWTTTAPARIAAKVITSPGSSSKTTPRLQSPSASVSITPKTNRIRGIVTPEKRSEFADKRVRVVFHVQKCLDRAF